ncbi:MAG TPA: hypothetical protein VJV96_15915 [Candidatus Angelobacter sp.]|jgi:hypothetical protein|nr:hypothetical protein [Candidatus Angelobacter sp.]
MSVSAVVPPRPAGGAGPRVLSLDWTSNGLSLLTANKGETVRFSSHEGALEITFLSPFGDDTISVTDAEDRTFTQGGIYPFRCTVNGVPREGGVVDIKPHP